MSERLEVHDLVDLVVRAKICPCASCKQDAEDTTEEPDRDETAIMVGLRTMAIANQSNFIPEVRGLEIRVRRSKRKKRHKWDDFEDY